MSPLVIVLMVLLTTGASMFVAALNVRYRDVKYVLPFLIQIWLFVTPIIYPMIDYSGALSSDPGAQSLLGHGGRASGLPVSGTRGGFHLDGSIG